MIEGSRFVFVGGLHRSGTTPLARTLAAHPSISGLTDTGVSEDEGQHLQDVYPRIRAYGGMGRFAQAPAAHLVETSPLVNDDNRRRLEEAWSPYWDLTRPLLLEKSPANLIMGRFLAAIFPNSALIVVVRHPVVVALAMQKWNPVLFARNGRRRVSLPGLVEHWIKAHQLLLDDLPSLERVHVRRYEDLVESPTGHLSQIQQFLRLDEPIDGSGIRSDRSGKYAEEWDAMRTAAPWTRRARRLVEERWGAEVERFGYDVTDLVTPLTPPVWCASPSDA